MKKTKTITTEVSSLNSFVCTIFICLLFSSALSNTLLLFTLNSSNSLSFHDTFFFSYQDWSLHSGSIDWAIEKKKKITCTISLVFLYTCWGKKIPEISTELPAFSFVTKTTPQHKIPKEVVELISFSPLSPFAQLLSLFLQQKTFTKTGNILQSVYTAPSKSNSALPLILLGPTIQVFQQSNLMRR